MEQGNWSLGGGSKGRRPIKAKYAWKSHIGGCYFVRFFCFVLCFKPNDWRKQTVLCGLEQLPVRAGAQWVLASGMVNASFLQGSDELAALGEIVIVMVEDSEEGIYSTAELQFCLPCVPRSEARPRHCSFLIWRLMDAFSIWWLGLSLSRQSAGCLCRLGKPPSSCSSLRLSPVLSSRPPCRPRQKAGLLPSLLPGCPVFSFFLLLLLRAFIIPVLTDSLKHHRWLSFFLFWLASHRAPDSILSALDPRCHSLSPPPSLCPT